MLATLQKSSLLPKYIPPSIDKTVANPAGENAGSPNNEQYANPGLLVEFVEAGDQQRNDNRQQTQRLTRGNQLPRPKLTQLQTMS